MAKTINTRLVLRNADLSAWEQSTVKLLSGEMALARLSGGEYDGCYKVRIGTGDKTWNELSDVGQLIIPAANVEGLTSTIAALSTSYYETTDIATLSDTYVNGDIAVEKKAIGETGKEQYCAYRWSLIDGAYRWAALDGNYSAENVFFPSDMTFTYDFGRFKTPATGSYTLSCAGQSVKTMLNDAFAKEEKISAKPVPTVALTASSGSYEVGTSVTPTFTLGFDAKTYKYGSNTNKAANSTTGVTAQTYKITYSKQGTTTELTGDWKSSVTDSAITVVEGTNLQTNALTGTFTLPADGTYVPLTNIGNQDADHRVTATSNTASSANTVTGYYKYFWTYKAEGATIAGLTKPNVTQADITALNADGQALQSSSIRAWSSGSSFTTSLSTIKMQQMFFACKKGKKTSITVKGSNPPAPQTVQGPFDLTVKDAAGADVTYSIFVVDNATAQGGADTFTITAS